MSMCSLESGVCCSEDGVLCSAYDSLYYCGILCSGCRRRNIRIYLERCGHIGKYARLLTGRALENNCLRNAECILTSILYLILLSVNVPALKLKVRRILPSFTEVAALTTGSITVCLCTSPAALFQPELRHSVHIMYMPCLL